MLFDTCALRHDIFTHRECSCAHRSVAAKDGSTHLIFPMLPNRTHAPRSLARQRDLLADRTATNIPSTPQTLCARAALG